ncbi:MAG TPA: T9SS type A sorting domain-containing protein, partial [Moheibacter sp.]|nr:T9SS type A sorting domain-containing protein [Moheibacter sp.]
GVIYAASEKGIFTHPLNEFIANFVSWEQPAGVPTTPFQQIVVFQNNIVASTNGNVYRFDGNNWTNMGNFPNLRDLNVNGNVLSVTQPNSVTNFNENFGMIETVSFSQNLNTALKVGNTTYGGSSLYGLINGLNEIVPDGPYNNKSWAVTAFDQQIWIAPGGVNNFNSPQLNADGFYHFNGTKWIHNTSQAMLDAKDIIDIEVNPKDSTEIFVSPWFEHTSWGAGESVHIGFFRFKNGQMVEHFNSENSPLLFRERIGGTFMDEEGNLWVTQSFVLPNSETLVHKKSPSGNWESIDLGSSGDGGVRKPFAYQNYGFIPLPRGGGLKVTDMQNVYTINSVNSSGNLPSDEIISAQIDKDGTLWIGTTLGIRVLYNPIEAVQSGSFQAEPVIIEQNGIPEAVLTDVQINDIEIDGANQKWVATETGGVYCFSEDGTETVFHFTAENSPLPSNKINDIEVENITGIVYFATDKGVVSYRSDVVETGDSFGDVYSYPNPVRPGFNGEVTIKGLPNDADVRIVDVVGNLVYKTTATGGVAKWDTKNMKGKLVASGIYLVLMTNQDASETKQTKIAIVR